jgi:hypothetical protein
VVAAAAFTDVTSSNNVNIISLNTKTYLNYAVFNVAVFMHSTLASVCYKKQSIDAEKGNNRYTFWESYKIRT